MPLYRTNISKSFSRMEIYGPNPGADFSYILGHDSRKNSAFLNQFFGIENCLFNFPTSNKNHSERNHGSRGKWDSYFPFPECLTFDWGKREILRESWLKMYEKSAPVHKRLVKRCKMGKMAASTHARSWFTRWLCRPPTTSSPAPLPVMSPLCLPPSLHLSRSDFMMANVSK